MKVTWGDFYKCVTFLRPGWVIWILDSPHTKIQQQKKGKPQFPLVKPVDDEKWSWLVCKMLIYRTLRDVKEGTNLWRKQGGGGGGLAFVSPLFAFEFPLRFIFFCSFFKFESLKIFVWFFSVGGRSWKCVGYVGEEKYNTQLWSSCLGIKSVNHKKKTNYFPSCKEQQIWKIYNFLKKS